MKEIFVAEANGQKLTTTGFGKFAAFSGRPANYVRAELTRIVNSEFVSSLELAERGGLDASQLDLEFLDAPRIKEHNKQVAKATAKLAAIAHLGEYEMVWEKASWHHTSELAAKAAHKVGGIVVPVEKVTE
jgi:hypothetical protein